MRVIRALEDIDLLSKSGAIDEEVITELRAYYSTLIENFSGIIEDVVEYSIVVLLENGDNLKDLGFLGLNVDAGGLLGSIPEFIDIVKIGKRSFYRILILHSTDYGLTFYCDKKHFEEVLESYVKENLQES